eukprot:TRINITY_DN110716_c0_g1_i1.p1 TRINITY_DN110716_c0_g1~~TRINITY_DN110716_c0_g1_i1.p1  ORF type:complete len:329 (-),score=89.49 TRINITY_DN110716_c0_g1_i1:41-994(-)
MDGSKAVAQILAATSLFGRLELSEEAVDVAVVRSHYYRLALAVHPDKCKDAKATEAFQALSEAFERLSSEAGQAQCLREAGVCRSAAKAQPRRPHEGSEEERKARWWDTRTWEEFEQRLKHRERTEAALRKQYFSGLRAKFEGRKVRGYVRGAERSVEHLDRNAGLPESPLWPPESTQAARDLEEEVAKARQTEPWPGAANELLPDYNERAELNDPALAIQRLLELMTHLRTVHLYCVYCGCRYDSADDMERNCPGITEEEHDEATSAGLRDSAETALDTGAADDGEAAEDPLEAYMASVDAELQKEDGRQKKRRRR